MNHSLHSEIHAITDTDEHARDFLFQRGILKSSMSCHSCSSNMTLLDCSKSKSPDLLIRRCTPCKKFKNIRSESVLSGQKLSLLAFLMLIFYLSVKRANPEVGMPRSSFYKYRYMAEMKIVDLAHYLYLKDQFRYVQ